MDLFTVYWNVIVAILFALLVFATVDIVRAELKDRRREAEMARKIKANKHRFYDLCRQVNIDAKADIRKQGEKSVSNN